MLTGKKPINKFLYSTSPQDKCQTEKSPQGQKLTRTRSRMTKSSQFLYHTSTQDKCQTEKSPQGQRPTRTRSHMTHTQNPIRAQAHMDNIIHISYFHVV